MVETCYFVVWIQRGISPNPCHVKTFSIQEKATFNLSILRSKGNEEQINLFLSFLEREINMQKLFENQVFSECYPRIIIHNPP